MSKRLCISVRFFTDRYHGDQWPPAPARLFQALVAGATAGCRILKWETSRSALKWLESLPIPEIMAAEAESGFAYKAYPPNNDSDAGKVVALVRSGIPLASAVRQAGMTTVKSFEPWVFSGSLELAVHYVWRLPEFTSAEEFELAGHVCALARNLLALGWGIDTVVGNGVLLAANTALPSGKHYLPAAGRGGIELLCPMPGTLANVENAYAAFRQRMNGPAVNTETRAKLFRRVRYHIADEAPGRFFVPFELRDAQGEEWQSFRWEDGMRVAAWLRHAAHRRFRIEGWDDAHIDAYVCGHTEKGEENNRLSYIPLPSIGHPHSDGRHRRALIVLPFDDDAAEETLAILHRMAGDPLEALDSKSPMAWLGLGQEASGRDGVLNHYLAAAKEWRSVTPVVLHGRDQGDGKFRPRKAEKLILQAFAESGYAEENIDEFSYQPAPFWHGAAAARQAQTPKHLNGWPRYHVRVAFKKPVKGPVLAGIGRHGGLGVFAASNESE